MVDIFATNLTGGAECMSHDKADVKSHDAEDEEDGRDGRDDKGDYDYHVEDAEGNEWWVPRCVMPSGWRKSLFHLG
jgi:hypothetical protein